MTIMTKFFLIILLFFSYGCVSQDDSIEKRTEGYMVVANDGVYFIVFDGTPYSLINVPRTTELFKNIVTTGDRVSIVIDSVSDSDPPLAAITSLMLIEKGELSTLPDDVLDVVKRLENMGWIIIE